MVMSVKWLHKLVSMKMRFKAYIRNLFFKDGVLDMGNNKPVMLIPNTFGGDIPEALRQTYDVVTFDAVSCVVDEAILARTRFLVTLGHPNKKNLRDMIDTIPVANHLVIQSGFAGVDIFENPPLRPHITLCRGEGLHNAQTAEHALRLTLNCIGGMLQMFKNQSACFWARDQYNDNLANGDNLEGKKVLIVGYGSIGKDIAKRLHANDAIVDGVVTTLRGRTFDIPVYEQKDLIAIAGNYDVIISVVPGGDGTAGMFNDAFFSSMKTTAFFVNVGRGSAVVEEALDKALRTKQIKGAAIDVATVENATQPDGAWLLWDAPNLIITPHIAGGGPNYFKKAWRLIAEQAQSVGTGTRLKYVVKEPQRNNAPQPKTAP
jgi:phosphoglycerate dehydrogenase-like enzyme